MKAMSKVTLTLGLMIIVSLFLTSCSGVVTPGINNGNTGNPSSNNPNSNNYQDPSTDPVEESATEESATEEQTTNPNSNNYQDPSTDPVEESATEESATEEVDTTKPVITGSRDPLPNSLGWNNSNVTVSFSCADTGPVQSGIDINTVAGETVTTEGYNQSVTNTGVCIDVAGNTADPVTISNINIDKTPPVVTITLSGTGEYVQNQSITATWSATDALSGVVSPVSGTVSIDTSSLGTKTFTLPVGTAMDKAGNSSLIVTISYSVIADTEDPEMIYPQQWATGTGTVGDPWANNCIQSAYDNAPEGGTIFLREGYYTLSTMLYIDKKINIIGEGINKTIIVTGVTTTNAIYMEGQDYITLQGFTIDGDSQTSSSSVISIQTGCSYITVKDIEVKNGHGSGIQYLESNYSTFQNIHAHDNGDVGLYSISNTAGKNRHNLYQDIYCYDNTDEGFKSRVGEGEVPIGQTNNVFDNIQCWDNGQNGIGIYYQKGIALSNSKSTGNSKRGLQLVGLKDSNIYNCLAALNKEEGMKLSYSNNVNFSNIISKNNNVSDAHYSGMKIVDNNNIVFTSCQSYDDRETPLQLYGIELTETNTGISLLNCKLTPNKNGAIYNPTGVVIAEKKSCPSI